MSLYAAQRKKDHPEADAVLRDLEVIHGASSSVPVMLLPTELEALLLYIEDLEDAVALRQDGTDEAFKGHGPRCSCSGCR